MFLLSTSSNGNRGPGFHRRPLTPAEPPPVSCTVRMGALCWVLPQEDEEVLEEGGGAGVVGKPPEEVGGWKNPGSGLKIQVTGDRENGKREGEGPLLSSSGVSRVLLLFNYGVSL